MKAILHWNRARPLLFIVISLCASRAAFAVDVRLCTTFGAVDVAVDDRAAPLHAANFLRYVESGFYDGTIIHRIVPGTMVQGGRFDPALKERTPNPPIANESNNGLENQRGTIAAARSDEPNSASSQFFFNLTDNSHLDGSNGTPGYTVFGRVTAGLDTLDVISGLPSESVGNLQDVPVGLIEVLSATVLDRSPVFGLSIEPDPAQLSADFDRASARGDAAATLAALDAMKQSCAGLSPSQIIAGAEAAIELRQFDRARYMLEPYLAKADPRDPTRPVAERLLLGFSAGETRRAVADTSRDVDVLIGRCRRPVAPSVPNGQFTERFTLQSVERAVLQFRQSSENYLNCVRQVVERTELDENETIAITKRYNDMVMELTAVSIRFNQAVANFRSAQPARVDRN